VRRMILGGVVCLTVACGGSAPAAPSPASFSGTWNGTITSSLATASAPATLTLSQDGSSLSGTWNLVGPDGAATGSLTGGAIGSLLAMTLSPSVQTQCPYTVNATVSNDRMTGVYASFNCTVVSSGSINLAKQ
jgi:hypothetical protein